MSESRLRPITPLSLAAGPTSPAVVPVKVAGPLPEIRWVAPESLLVEEDYQRSLSEKSKWLIRRIVGAWSWAHVKPPIVARIEDDDRLEKTAKRPSSPVRRGDPRYAVIDGQHTAIAAASHVPAAVAAQRLHRNPKVEEAALAAIDKGPADFATIRARTDFPANAVRLALEALRADKVIQSPRGIYERRGIE